MSPVFYISSLVMIAAIVANGFIKSRKKKIEQQNALQGLRQE
jgi:hypothetical protein